MSTTPVGGAEDVSGHLVAGAPAARTEPELAPPLLPRALLAPTDPRPPTTTVVRAPVRLLAGSGALLVVDVAGAAPAAGGSPTGGVRALLDSGVEPGAELGRAELDERGRALLTVALPRGEHVLRVAYDGDADWGPSAAAPRLLRVVAHPTTVTLAAAPGEQAGEAVLTATVRSDTTAPAPSGTVVFCDGSRELGTASLGSEGVAALPVGALETGVHRIVAAYSGDVAHAAARSAAMPHAVHVRRRPTSLALDLPDVEGGDLRVRVLRADGASRATGATGEVVLCGPEGELARLPLVDGTARGPLPPGADPGALTARYAGDVEHEGSSTP